MNASPPTDEVLAGLDPFQMAAVTSAAPLLAIIAGAGSGKTTVLTRRVAHRCLTGAADASHTVVLTFTRQAAGELRRRLSSLGLRDQPVSGTFHAVALRLLRQYWDDNDRRHPTLVADRSRLVGEVLGARHSGRLFDIVTDIDWARARRVAPDKLESAARELGRTSRAGWAQVAKAMKDIEVLKRKRGVIDLDDLLETHVTLASEDPAFVEAIRWRLRHFFVDEAQDLNPLQEAVLSVWRGGRDDLTLVGDPSQAIYGFNGADSRLLLRLEERFPGVEVVRLDQNYRCTPQIVQTGLGALARSSTPLPNLVSTRSNGEVPVAYRFENEQAEADGIAQVVAGLRLPMGRWRDLAVLARTNAQLPPIKAALEKVGIPASISGAAALDPVQVAVRSAAEQTGRERLATWSRDARQPDDDSTEDEISARRRVADAVDEFLAEGGRDGLGFATWVRTARPFQADARPDAVELVTFHAAKGREWYGVVIAGSEIGLVPHFSAKTEDERNEEIRLSYVAITRASDRLVFTYSASRNGRDTRPSEFLSALPIAPAPEPPSVDFLEGQRRRRQEPALAADPLVAEIEQWRRGAARVAGVSPAMILSDRAVRAIAELRPSSIDELEAIEGVGRSTAMRIGPRVLEAISRLSSADRESGPDLRTSPDEPR
jgi:DNA helicase II / ATP-dependent DNA helicase PcrA